MRPALATATAIAALGLFSPAFAETPKTVEAFSVLPVIGSAQHDFLEVMNKNVVASRKEQGNLSFDAFVNEDGKPGVFVFERWSNQAAIDAHMKTPNLKAVGAAVPKATNGDPTVYWLQEVPQIPAAPAKHVETPRNVVVIFTTTDKTRAAFLDAMAKLTPNARAAKGNEGFNIFQVKGQPDQFMVVERWDNVKDHEAHLAAPYSKDFDKAVKGLLAADPMKTRWLLSEAPRDK